MEKPLLSQKSVNDLSLINNKELNNLIAINEPYFGLKEIFVDDKTFVTAHLPIEQPIGSELIPISSAEACRHMSALGMISCGHKNPIKNRYFYLPLEIDFKRICDEVSSNKSNFLLGSSICTYFDKNKAIAKTQITDPKRNVISEAEISYKVISEKVFEGLYKSSFIKSPDFSMENPYKIKNELFDIRLTTTNLTASLGKIPQYYCVGHFSQYPSLPFSTIMYNLVDLAGLFIYHSTRDYRLRFKVKEISFSNKAFAFAGEKVDLEIKHMQSFDNLFILSCTATANGSKNVGEMELTIEGIK